jgi:hypothetical protein
MSFFLLANIGRRDFGRVSLGGGLVFRGGVGRRYFSPPPLTLPFLFSFLPRLPHLCVHLHRKRFFGSPTHPRQVGPSLMSSS